MRWLLSVGLLLLLAAMMLVANARARLAYWAGYRRGKAELVDALISADNADGLDVAGVLAADDAGTRADLEREQSRPWWRRVFAGIPAPELDDRKDGWR